MTRSTALRRTAAALSCCAALAAAACTDAEGTADGPTDSQRTTTPAPTAQPSTSPPPTPEEEAAAAALAAYEGYWDVYQGYSQAPRSRNWEPEIRRWVDAEAAAVNLSVVQGLLEDGIRQVGESTVAPQVTDIDLAAEPGPTVSITACFTPGEAYNEYIDSGAVASPPEEGSWELLVTVIQYPEQESAPWLVHSSEPQRETPC